MLVFIGIVLLCFTNGDAVPVKNVIDLRMPNVKPQKNDTYLCHGLKLRKEPIFITEFIPEAKMEIAHHVLLYGCSELGSEENYWNCGEMGSAKDKVPVKHASICKSGSKIIYAWAMDAPKLRLPKQVSFKVGGNTGINGLVLQIHYKNAKPFLPPSKKTDNSGIKLIAQSTPTPKLAGIYLMATDGVVPAKSQVYFDVACKYTGKSVLHPFAYRVHTHSHGELVSGYRVRNGKWKEIGKNSPKKPQMFYKLNKAMKINPGDDLAARCVMNNLKGTKEVAVGNTQSDEMCNFYMMYWVYADAAAQLSDKDNQKCWSKGFPSYGWSVDKNLNLKGIPPASTMLQQKMLEMSDNAKYLFEEVQQLENEEERLLNDIENSFSPMDRRSYMDDDDSQESYLQDDTEDWS